MVHTSGGDTLSDTTSGRDKLIPPRDVLEKPLGGMNQSSGGKIPPNPPSILKLEKIIMLPHDNVVISVFLISGVFLN